MTESASNVFRDFNTPGVPASGEYAPEKVLVRRWGREVEAAVSAAQANGGLIFDTRANLDGSLAHAANTSAWVIDDATVENNGIYRKAGGSGSGSWSKVADLPYSFIVLSDVGAGTPNAIQATSDIPLPSSPYKAILTINVSETNTANGVTLAVNGATARPLVSVDGSVVAGGTLVAGMGLLVVDDGTSFRILTDLASAGNLAAAQAARDEAEAQAGYAEEWAQSPDPISVAAGGDGLTDKSSKTWAGESEGHADDAEASALVASGAMSAVVIAENTFATKATAEAWEPVAGPDYIRTAGYASAGDGGGAVYKKVGSEPAHDGKLYITLDDAVTTVWYEIAEQVVNAKMFGAAYDGTTNDTAAWQAAVDCGAAKIHALPGISICGTVTLRSGVCIEGSGHDCILKKPSGSNFILYGDSGSPTAFLEGLTLRNFAMDGGLATSGFVEFRHCVRLDGARRVLVEGVLFRDFQGDGIIFADSTSSLAERHNEDIIIRDSIFDGVSNGGRNGLSIIDGKNVLIAGNTFRNCAKSDMPGSLCIEPDHSWAFIKDIRIANNLFENTNGNRAHIALSVDNIAEPHRITIIGNHFDGQTAISIYTAVALPAAPHDFLFAENICVGAAFINKVSGAVWGLTVRGNRIRTTGTAIACADGTSANTVRKLDISGNDFIYSGSAAILSLTDNMSECLVQGNRFDGGASFGRAITFGLTGTTCDKLVIVGNRFLGSPSSGTLITANGTHTAASNVVRGNSFSAAYSLPALDTDFAGTGTNTATAATLPSSFPFGESFVTVSSGSGFPDSGTQYGLLRTTRYRAGSGSDPSFCHQVYVPAHDGANQWTFYMRKAKSDDTWETWKAFVGA